MIRYSICVTGHREFSDYDLLARSLDDVIEAKGAPTSIMHGGAPGADALASRFAYERKIDLDIRGALWGRYGSKAGPIRNQSMRDSLIADDVVVAFPGANSRGTWHMVNICLAAELEVLVISRPEVAP